MTCSYKGANTVNISFRMSDLEWIGAASKAFTYCGHLLGVIKKLEKKFLKIQEEVARLKTLVERQKKFIDELTGKEENVHRQKFIEQLVGNDGGYDTVY